jgi:adenylate cyclase
MAQEIERKFLVKIKEWELLKKPTPFTIKQGYISTDPNKTIRVRQSNAKGFLTIKGKGNGISRPEFEYEISLPDTEELLAHFAESILEKHRYEIFFEGKKWEVDVFLGANSGLIVAEIELNNENEQFTIPHWIAEEVTFDQKYYNSNLINHPYSNW